MLQKKLSVIFFLSSSIIVFSSYTEKTQNLPFQPVVFNLNGFNSNTSENFLQAQQTNTQKVTTTYNHTHTHVVKLDLPDFKMPSLPSLSNPSSYFWNYRWYAAAGITSICYFYINFKVYMINKLLENPKSWALWKEEITLNRLTTINKQDLS